MPLGVTDIVAVWRTSPSIVAASDGRILRYIGKPATIIEVMDREPDRLYRLKYRDGFGVWASDAMLRK